MNLQKDIFEKELKKAFELYEPDRNGNTWCWKGLDRRYDPYSGHITLKTPLNDIKINIDLK
jgi:hypothetical protein